MPRNRARSHAISSHHFADRLLRACKDKGTPVCVGVDPVFERLPAEFAQFKPVQAIAEFSRQVVQTVAPLVPCVKIQSACFERYHEAGVAAYHELTNEASAMGVLVIGDAKRGDIGISAEHYAAGCLSSVAPAGESQGIGPDALTINSYFGHDGIDPFIKIASAEHKGLFALVRTSNPGGDAIQSLQLADGSTVAETVARLIARLGASCMGQSGYSLLGAVVGATKVQEVASLRKIMPHQLFLVPGFGAQGGSAQDIKACFNADGRGAIITASRSILFAYEKDKAGSWQSAVERATIEMKQQVAMVMERD